MSATPREWYAANQRHLLAALDEVRRSLERHAQRARSAGAVDAAPDSEAPRESARATRASHPTQDAVPVVTGRTGRAYDAAPPALERVCAAFELSPFERSVLLLCAGVELEGSFAAICAEAQGDSARPYPTFSLALAALPEPHWSALAPDAPLRRWRLVEIAPPGTPITTSPLRIDEHILHYLVGLRQRDERLAGLIEPLPADLGPVPSHQTLARRIVAAWSSGEHPMPVVELVGSDESSKRAVAAIASAMRNLLLFSAAADALPANASELEGLLRLWEREARLMRSALYVEAEGVDATGDAARAAAITRLVEHASGEVILGTRQRWPLSRRAMLSLDVHKPTPAEQREAWKTLLDVDAAALAPAVDRLVGEFDVSVPVIRAAVREARSSGAKGEELGEELWESTRAQSRPRLDDLAQRIVPTARWKNLVLPELQMRMLWQIVAQVRQRTTVYEEWGFAGRSTRGLGISALFAGGSGTGKTMAAEVLANELSLDLYRIDLASVVSKYVGETPKNLRRVFDAAENGGILLLFDEADALFGKRGEIKDSHDRYAHVEVSYLLQRMEAYRGPSILTTNMRQELDSAFLRRIRFIVDFPFPDLERRAEIWAKVFPDETPREGLKPERLARLNVPGGSIRNIAMGAAFLAAEETAVARAEANADTNAEDRVPVNMKHILRAAATEYAKLERPLTDTEIAGWV
jgi:SpoVK/Ycf46/Vps4 family AAA+-type ATPase